MTGGQQLKPWPADAKTLDEILIGDGLCYRGFIEAVPGVHGCFQYVFRPMLPVEVTVTQGRINKLSDEGKKAEAEALVARVVSEHITWTSVTEGPITAEQVGQLPNPVYNRLYMQLLGMSPMDSRYAEGPTAGQQLADDLGN